MSTAGAPTTSDRIVILSLDQEFRRLHSYYCSLILATPQADIYRQPHGPNGRSLPAVAECVLRGAASVEQTFGGITANLWDDPFEWTLPENLSTGARIVEYLVEVEATRQLGFASFLSDADLLKEIMGPAAETRTLINLVTETMARTAEYYGRAATTFSLLTEINRQ